MRVGSVLHGDYWIGANLNDRCSVLEMVQLEKEEMVGKKWKHEFLLLHPLFM